MKTLWGARWEIALSSLKRVAMISNPSEGKEAAQPRSLQQWQSHASTLKYEHSPARMEGDGHLLHEVTSAFHPAARGRMWSLLYLLHEGHQLESNYLTHWASLGSPHSGFGQILRIKQPWSGPTARI